MIVTRFAPSPTGLLHLGHAFAALRAAEAGGRFMLRIEDIDPARSRADFIDAIFEDLRWLGLRWDEPVLRQSERMAVYRAALDLLAGHGLVYLCFCTRKEIAAEIARAPSAPQEENLPGDGPVYPGTCKRLSPSERAIRIENGAAYALRLDAEKAARAAGPLTFTEHGALRTVDPLLFGDIVLARKEVPASYHLACVVDDAHQGVTLVTRGEDLLPATHVQRLLQTLLGLEPPAYAHHRLILDPDGRKFSKRDGTVTLASLRASGLTPDDIRASLAC